MTFVDALGDNHPSETIPAVKLEQEVTTVEVPEPILALIQSMVHLSLNHRDDSVLQPLDTLY